MSAAIASDAAARPAVPSHLLGLDELGADGIAELLRLTDHFVEIGRREIPRVPALRGKTVANMFFEDSTRTRLSFEAAAKRLSADVLNFSAGSSSLSKGESLRDTVETVQAMGVDAFVVRHRSSGVPWQVTDWVDDGVSVLNAGDGWHSHPTQGLLDAYTLCQQLHGGAGEHPRLDGVHVGLIGDIRHSRVARSDVQAFTALGASVTLVAPPTLLPPSLEGWDVAVSHDLDAVLSDLDVVGLLRVQQERMSDGLIPSIDEYVASFGLTAARARAVKGGAIVTHPGPVVRGVEVAGAVLDQLDRVVITDQVTNGVAVRQAALFWLLGSGGDLG